MKIRSLSRLWDFEFSQKGHKVCTDLVIGVGVVGAPD
jgi:hypothetical protein